MSSTLFNTENKKIIFLIRRINERTYAMHETRLILNFGLARKRLTLLKLIISRSNKSISVASDRLINQTNAQLIPGMFHTFIIAQSSLLET